MSSCEKCWADARWGSESYSELVLSQHCTPEEQAGRFAKVCPNCKRKTIHQMTNECMTHCQKEDHE